MPKIKIGGLYRHFKGKNYRVVSLARDCETLEELVVYEPLYQSETKLWVRPKENFLERVSVNGKKVPRFKLLS